MVYNDLKSLYDDSFRISRAHYLPIRQDSLKEQLNDLHVLAVRYGLTDAAEWLRVVTSSYDG